MTGSRLHETHLPRRTIEQPVQLSLLPDQVPRAYFTEDLTVADSFPTQARRLFPRLSDPGPPALSVLPCSSPAQLPPNPEAVRTHGA